jgi:hypothetical protein
MIFKNEVTVGDILTLLGLLVASIGLFFTWLSMRRGNRQARAQFLIDLLNQYRSDADLLSMYYEIEYGEFAYDGNFHTSEKEKKLDKLLGYFENIAKLWRMGNITVDDVQIVAYEIIVLYQDNAVKEYLAFLDEWFAERGIKARPYAAFRDLGEVLQQRFYA